MSLLAFELNGPSPVSDLLTPAQRQKLASELNSALLLSQSQEKDPKVLFLCLIFDRQIWKGLLCADSFLPISSLGVFYPGQCDRIVSNRINGSRHPIVLPIIFSN